MNHLKIQVMFAKYGRQVVDARYVVLLDRNVPLKNQGVDIVIYTRKMAQCVINAFGNIDSLLNNLHVDPALLHAHVWDIFCVGFRYITGYFKAFLLEKGREVFHGGVCFG